MLTIELQSQLQTWITPIKVRSAMVAVWDGDTIVGERLSHYTIKDEQVLGADQWQMQIASVWLALGGLLQFIWKNREVFYPADAKLEPRKINVNLPPGRINLGCLEGRGADATYHGTARPGSGLTIVSPGYRYQERCELLVEELEDAPECPLHIEFVVNASTREARTIMLDKSVTNEELMGMKHAGQRVLRMLQAEENLKLDKFFNKIAPKRRRAIGKKKPK